MLADLWCKNAVLFNWTARLIRLRKECPEIGWGAWTLLPTGAPHVLAMRYDRRGSSVVTVHDLADAPQAVRLRPGVDGGERLLDLLEEDESRARLSGAARASRRPAGDVRAARGSGGCGTA